MKKFWCYFGIFALLLMVLLPPALRIFVPKKEEEKINTSTVRTNLRCSNDKYIIGTSYDDKDVKAIVLKKFKPINDEETTESEEQEENENPEVNSEDEQPSEETDNNTDEQEEEVIIETELDEIFETLKEEIPSEVSVQEDGEVISIDFSLSDNSHLSIEKLNRSIEEQQEYYEEQGLVCSIM